ncbi:MAG: TatD family nuclease-associated radical SAM protein, partial [bacterium]
MNPALVYGYRGNWYVNLTNRCTATCTFCIKFSWKMDYRGHDLRLSADAEADEVIAALERRAAWRRQRRYPPFRGEIVFCGYGEPLLRLETLKAVASWAHARGLKTRANSLGQVNIVTGRNVLAELDGALDGLSVSLNAHDEPAYDAYVWHRRIFDVIRENVS